MKPGVKRSSITALPDTMMLLGLISVELRDRGNKMSKDDIVNNALRVAYHDIIEQNDYVYKKLQQIIENAKVEKND